MTKKLTRPHLKTGRPLTINEPAELERIGNNYLDDCFTIVDKSTGKIKSIPTISGLALACGLSGREALFEYEHRPEFSNVVKKLKSRISNFIEKALFTKSSTGAIFWLKCHGWQQTPDSVTINNNNINIADTKIISALMVKESDGKTLQQKIIDQIKDASE